MKFSAVLGLVIASLAPGASACDLCSVYGATEAQGDRGKGFLAGVAEQFTSFGTVQADGHRVEGEGQYIDSSVSQVFAGYNFNDRFGLQLNLPVIYRSFGSHTEHGHVSGIGDLALLGNFRAVQKDDIHFAFGWSLSAGLKFPTGDSSRLDTPDSALPEGIGGHDLALGSGSYDGIVGTGIYARCRRLFISATTQYAIRSKGDFEHRYANDLVWFGGPGYYIVLEDFWTLSLQAVVSGETKGKDTFSGVPDEDSAETLVYIGPELSFTKDGRLSVLLGADLPVYRWNSGTQVLPDYRVRAALTWRF